MSWRHLLIIALVLLNFGRPTHAQELPEEITWLEKTASQSALGPEELVAFTKSSLFTTLLSSAVDQINKYPTFRTAPQELFQSSSGPQILGFPFLSGELIFSREVMTGPFEGTDRILQLADQFGVRLSAGVNIGTRNLPTTFRAGFNGNLSISRIFSHLKPILSIKRANRYPFKNAFVSFFMKKQAALMDPLMEKDFPELPLSVKKRIYGDAFRDLLEAIAPGDTLVITDSLNLEAKLSGGGSLYQIMDISGHAKSGQVILRRIQIHRLDETTFQVFDDDGKSIQSELGLQFGLRSKVFAWDVPYLLSGPNKIDSAVIPIFRLRWGKNKGNAHTRLFELSADPDPQTDQTMNESVIALQDLHHVLKEHDVSETEKHRQPVTIENVFDEKSLKNRFPLFSAKKLWSTATYLVETAQQKQAFIREFFGRSKGFNFSYSANHAWSFVKELFTHSPSDYIEDNVINPAYSSNGIAVNTTITFEAEQTPTGDLKDQFVQISKIHNGWNLSVSKIQKALEKWDAEYGDGTYPDPFILMFDRLFLFSIRMDIDLSEKGIQYLLSLSKEQIQEIFFKHGIDLSHRRIDDRIERHLEKFMADRSVNHFLRAISIADRKLNSKGLIDLFGGEQNVLITLKVEGFSQPDLSRDAVFYSESFPIAGKSKSIGPLQKIQKRLKMGDGEFHSLWIRGRIL